MEDLYFTVSDSYKFFEIEKKYKKQFEELKKVFGCIWKTRNKLKGILDTSCQNSFPSNLRFRDGCSQS